MLLQVLAHQSFLPFNNLGLIIIDEEHDPSYSQDSSPCYDAINVAIKGETMIIILKVLLASASPSINTFYKAKNKIYNLLTLDKRINNKLPLINFCSSDQNIFI